MRPPVGPSLFGGCCCRAPAYWLNSLARHALASSPHLSSPTLSHLSLACGHDVALWEFDARNPRRDAPSARSGPVLWMTARARLLRSRPLVCFSFQPLLHLAVRGAVTQERDRSDVIKL